MRILVLFLIGLFSLNLPALAKQTSLHEEVIYRVSLGAVKDAMTLVRRLGNPNAVDNLGWPLLAIAAGRTDDQALPMVEALVSVGADVNYDGGRKNYPMIMAIQSDNDDVVEFLLQHGANYRATDAYGMRVVDFARQSGNEKITRLIEQAIDQDILGLTQSRSQDYLNKLTRQLAYHTCASTYYSYYYQSEQDEIPQEEQKVILAAHNSKVSFSMSRMASLFSIPAPNIEDIYVEARKLMHTEMELMVSNRWRRIKGVGQPGDMEERCARLTEKWNEQVLDKDDFGF